MRRQKGGGAMSVIARHCTPGVKPPSFSGVVVLALGPSCRRALSFSSSRSFSLYSMSCCTRHICCRWRSMTSWLWAVAASTLLSVSLELPASAAEPLPPFTVSGVSIAGAVWIIDSFAGLAGLIVDGFAGLAGSKCGCHYIAML